MKSFTLIRQSLCIALLIWAGGLLRAEGTAQLMPAGSVSGCISYVQGNDGLGKEGPTYGRPATDMIYFHIADPASERIYYGFTRKLPTNKPVYYQIRDPLGAIVVSGRVAQSSSDSGYVADDGVAAYLGPSQIAGAGGYTALSYQPLMAGDYWVQFNVNHPTDPKPSETKYFVHPFDITIADISGGSPVAIDGRVFSYKWHLNTNSSSNKACMSFYTWTPDSLVVRMDMNEIQPFGYTVSFNSHGAQNTGDIETDRRSTKSVSASIAEYRVFLNEPDVAVYPTGTPGEVEYVEVNTCGEILPFCIMVQTTKPGELNVYIDLDGDSLYTESGRDVYFPYATSEMGEICIPWDGLDGNGNLISDTTVGLVMVEFLAGIVHYPVWDPENHAKGFTCAMIRPAGMTPLMYWDNRGTSINTYDLTGCSAKCNSWTNNKGDNVMVNTWLNTITSADTDAFVITRICPPLPRNDSTCTADGLSLDWPILANDSARTYPLDPYTVTLGTPLSGSGYAVFNPDNRLLSYLPDANDTTTFILPYTLCDSLSGAGGGPLCKTAYVIISQYADCPHAQVLEVDAFPLEAWQVGAAIHLHWTDPQADGRALYRIVQSVDGHMFRVLDQSVGHAGQTSYTYRDTAVQQASALFYRIERRLPGRIAYSTVVTVTPSRPDRPVWYLHPNPARTSVSLTYASDRALVFHLTDPVGRRLQTQVSAAGQQEGQCHFDLGGLPPGLYLIVAQGEHYCQAARFRRD
ncbi:MAG: hypothetical protein OHK0039_06310 [Bacteroidia bacterium]